VQYFDCMSSLTDEEFQTYRVFASICAGIARGRLISYEMKMISTTYREQR
jgi:hypothetical protein